jgi:hypothetical protein
MLATVSETFVGHTCDKRCARIIPGTADKQSLLLLLLLVLLPALLL